jgi:two-component system, OmpR family, alkaline phosphatase synthesis response regulator PhoP
MKRILVVDDDKGALTLIGIMLERGGFHVIKARDGHEALEILAKETPNLIILDLMMPLMDGFKLTTLIRQRSGTATTPILILSARSDAPSILASMERGATDYLSKPIMHHDLVAKALAMMEHTTPILD